jgi:hypothetical protein
VEDDELLDPRGDLAQPVEVEMRLAFELVGAVRGADRHGERVHIRLLGEPHGLVRTRQHRPCRLLAEILDAAERAELGLHVHAAGEGVCNDVARLAHVLVERLAGRVDYHGRVAGVDRRPRQLLALAVVEMQRDRRVRVAGQLADDRHQVLESGVLDRALGGLDEQRRRQFLRRRDHRARSLRKGGGLVDATGGWLARPCGLFGLIGAVVPAIQFTRRRVVVGCHQVAERLKTRSRSRRPPADRGPQPFLNARALEASGTVPSRWRAPRYSSGLPAR